MATGLQIEGGGIQGLPTILKDWISYGQDYVREGEPIGYGFNEKLGFMNEPFYRNTNNYEWSFDPQTGAPKVRVKTADKTGTFVNYAQDAAGNWVPDYGTQDAQRWETNNNDDFYKGLALVFGSAVAGNLAAASGALGGAAQGAWQGGMAATPAAAAGSELALSGAIPELSWGSASGIPLGSAGGAVPELGFLAPEAAGAWTGAGAATSLPWDVASAGELYGPPAEAAIDYSMGPPSEYAGSGKPWYSDLMPDWKDLVKQGVKQYVNSQASGGGGGSMAGGGGYPSSSRGGPGFVGGTPNESSPVPIRPMPMGGLIPPGAENPVEMQAQLLAQTLAKKRGMQYG
jgi:hypothetical protein